MFSTRAEEYASFQKRWKCVALHAKQKVTGTSSFASDSNRAEGIPKPGCACAAILFFYERVIGQCSQYMRKNTDILTIYDPKNQVFD